ncbi:phage baseplate assembly protein V [Xenorhabdus szentirmaii]|uniref:phage baseplate assembly protein V n=1 Tax=Xenorhabdus szentirmaii TaxID=290112 RepID=UPI0019AF11CD|nr:phage baseplate assembly protein V [Xenorhabdus sp. 5]MBD2826595.1 hypothetical protein [Xenorhabdus sp. 5]
MNYGSKKKKTHEFQLVKVNVKYAINNVPFAELTLSANNESYGCINGNEAREMEYFIPGSEINISRNGKPLFFGVITERNYTIARRIKTVTLRAHHKMQAMRALFRSQLFNQQNDADILRSIFKDHGVNIGKIDGLTAKHPQMVQFNCFDWQFVRARLSANAVWLLAGPEKITIIKPTLKKTAQTISGKESEKHIKIRVSQNNRFMPKRVSVSSWNIEKQEMNPVSVAEPMSLGDKAFNARNLNTLSQKEWILNHSLALQPQEQATWANSRLLALYGEGIQGEIETEGNLGYELGQTLDFKNFGAPLDGRALVTTITHTFSKFEWRTQLVLGSDWLQDLDTGMVPGIRGIHIGQVAENKDGPDKNHCLKVTMPILGKDNKPLQLLARLSTPFASNGSGLNLYPEEKDEVVLAFLEDDPRYPIILGAMHNPINPAPNAELNKGRGIVIKHDGKTQYLLLHPDEGIVFKEEKGEDNSKLVLKQGELLTQSSKKTEIDAKDLLLKGDNLEIRGANDVLIKGRKVKLNQ